MTSRQETAGACKNCGGVKCMSCVFREMHDGCEEDCPFCCPEWEPKHREDSLNALAEAFMAGRPGDHTGEPTEQRHYVRMDRIDAEDLAQIALNVLWGESGAVR